MKTNTLGRMANTREWLRRLTPICGVAIYNAFLLAGCDNSTRKSGEGAATAGEAAEAPAQESSPSANQGLSGTKWRLVEIQSMDDSVGTKRPDDSSKYTMELNADGSVAMRLNCNRARGTWTSKPGADAASGEFTFGAFAGTRALCPPPSLDEQITAQAQYVRSYLIRDGRLNLSLMADGGIIVWEPIPTGTE